MKKFVDEEFGEFVEDSYLDGTFEGKIKYEDQIIFVYLESDEDGSVEKALNVFQKIAKSLTFWIKKVIFEASDRMDDTRYQWAAELGLENLADTWIVTSIWIDNSGSFKFCVTEPVFSETGHGVEVIGNLHDGILDISLEGP